MAFVYDCPRCGRHYERNSTVIVNVITCCDVASKWRWEEVEE